MGTAAAAVMSALHGHDIYDGFAPGEEADLQGWNSDHPVFAQLVAALRPRLVIDVGVWKGRSSIFLANLLRTHGLDGVVISVDTFLGSTEHYLGRHDPGLFCDGLRPRHGWPQLYWQYLSNVVRTGFADSIVPLPQTSANAALILRRIGVRAGLIHIDAAHEYAEVLADARAYWTLLQPGGVLVGDDYSGDWPGVVAAADAFASETGVPLQLAFPKWVMAKPSA